MIYYRQDNVLSNQTGEDELAFFTFIQLFEEVPQSNGLDLD